MTRRGKIATWHFININSGAQGVETPYSIGKKNCHYIASKPPLRHGSYRGLAATANNFAREVFMDELAAVAGADPLAFRLAHLENPRLRAVLEKAAKEFDWEERVKRKDPDLALAWRAGRKRVPLWRRAWRSKWTASGKNSRLRHVCQAFECGEDFEPGEPAFAGSGRHHHGTGRGLARGDAV